MKKPVMQRAMFMAVGVPKEESKGIISGFDDEMENEDYEERTPENLEIIANNLRGDIRSLDERYLELAQLVGEAAFETPEEVVALMQSQMGPAQPQGPGAGIGSLGAPPMPQQPQGIMQGIVEGPQQPPTPPMPPMAPPPGGQAPIQMAYGGPVHRQAGSPPGGERAFANLNERLMQAAGKPGMFTRIQDFIGAADDRITNMLSRQLQTTGPTTAAGKPVPFVDRFGRFYQPVGGTNPNMPSRGAPMPSKFNLGRMTKFGGPVGIAGGMATQALIESDPSRGQLYGSMFDLETGAGAGERPGFNIVRPTGYQYIDSSTLVPEALTTTPGATPEAAPEAGALPPPPPPATTEGGFTPTGVSGVISPEFLAESARLKAGEGEKEKTLQERVRDKLAIYRDVLGDDQNARQAQALFLLAEASLNVAGATGRSVGERLAKGLKGLPAGMAALGAEAERNRRAVAAAALSSVESEIADERRIIGQQQLQRLRNSKDMQSIGLYANYLVQAHGFNPDEAMNVAMLSRNGDLTFDKDKNVLVDRLGKQYGRKDGPVQPGDFGYLDPQRPDVEVTERYMPRATEGERKAILDRRSAAAETLAVAERAYRDLESAVGPMPAFKSMFSRGYTTLFGPSAVGFTDTERDAKRNEITLAYEKLMAAYRRNESRESVYAMQQIQPIFGKPDDFFTSPQRVMSVLNNVRREMANQISLYDSQLYGTPVRQTIPFGTGEADSPIDLRKPGSQLILDDYFRLKGPNSSLYVITVDPKDPNKTSKMVIEGDRYETMKKQQKAPQ